jgi:hypothetical protein
MHALRHDVPGHGHHRVPNTPEETKDLTRLVLTTRKLTIHQRALDEEKFSERIGKHENTHERQ